MFGRGTAALGAVLATLCAPAVAHAASVNIAVGADPLEDRAIAFTSSAVTDGQNVKVYAKWRPADANPCPGTYTAATGRDVFFNDAPGQVKSLTLGDPGTYAICAYLAESSGATPIATSAVQFAVRANTATIAVGVPPAGQTDAQIPVTFSGTTEVGRELYARVKPVGAGPCGQSIAADPTSGSIAFGIGLAGAFNVPRLTDRISAPGQYTVCAWVQESSSSPLAEAAGSAVLNVLPPRPLPSELNFGDTSFPAVPFGSWRTTNYRGGTTINFSMNTPATARFTVYRRVGRRYRRVRGSFSFGAKTGYNSFRFSGRVGGRTLKRGRYRMTMSTQNAAGKGTVRRKVFRITRRP